MSRRGGAVSMAPAVHSCRAALRGLGQMLHAAFTLATPAATASTFAAPTAHAFAKPCPAWRAMPQLRAWLGRAHRQSSNCCPSPRPAPLPPRHRRSLLYRSDREYDEAIKCYKNALRMDKENLTVMRDLALLQARPMPHRRAAAQRRRGACSRARSRRCASVAAAAPACLAPVSTSAVASVCCLPTRLQPCCSAGPQIQMRDMPGFLETRQTLLELKSNNKHNWISFALAHHLNGHYEVAVKVLESYEGEWAAVGRGGVVAGRGRGEGAHRRPTAKGQGFAAEAVLLPANSTRAAPGGSQGAEVLPW